MKGNLAITWRTPAGRDDRGESVESRSTAIFEGGFPGPILEQVKHIPAPPKRQFHREVVKPYRPVLLKGLIADWPALGEWSIDFVLNRYGDCHWHAMIRKNGEFEASTLYGYNNPVLVREHLTKALKLETEDYLNVPFETLPLDLAAMAPPLPYTQGASHMHREVFLGSEVNGVPLHFHLCQNMLTQLSGSKQVMLFHPLQARRLGWVGPLRGNPNFSRMDPYKPNRRYWNRYQRAKGFVVDLQPGDALYIPCGWWHATKTLSPSISLVNRWANGWSTLPVVVSAFFDRVTSLVKSVGVKRQAL